MPSFYSSEPWRLSLELLVARASLDAQLFLELLSNGDQYVRSSGVAIPSEIHLHFYVPQEGLTLVDSGVDVFIPLRQSAIDVDRLTHHTLQSSAEREALQLNLNQTTTEQTQTQTTTTTTTAEAEVEIEVAAVVEVAAFLVI